MATETCVHDNLWLMSDTGTYACRVCGQGGFDFITDGSALAPPARVVAAAWASASELHGHMTPRLSEALDFLLAALATADTGGDS